MSEIKLSDASIAEISAPGLQNYLYIVNDTGPTQNKITQKRLLGQVHNICQGRLTLTSLTPIPTANVTGATSIYWTPYLGDQISIYDGTRWILYQFTEATIALGTLTSAKNYDIFAWDSSGTLSYKIGPAWSSDTARGTGAGTTELVLQNGVLVNNVSITSGPGALAGRYLGSFRTTSTTTTEDSFTFSDTANAPRMFLYNYYNQVRRYMNRIDSSASWTYTTDTYQQARASTKNQIEVLVGVVGGVINIFLNTMRYGTASVTTYVSIGLDGLTPHADNQLAYAFYAGASPSNIVSQISTLNTLIPLGYHYFTWLERSTAAGTTTWYGQDTASPVTYRSGLSAVVMG